MSPNKAKSRSKSVEVMEVDQVEKGADEAEVKGAVEGEGEAEVDGGGGEGEDDEDDDEEADENEFEVEGILDHKQTSGKFIYLVSWKGYGPEHNTWEPEEHVSHARQILEKYWSTKPKNTGVQKGKRTRTSAAGSIKSEPPSARKAKVSRTSTNGNSKRKTVATAAAAEDEEEDGEEEVYEQTHVDAMDKYADVRDWEDLVVSVDTIQRGNDGELKVFMTMTGGEKVNQATDVAYNRCPQKILKFYEAHLKWKVQ